MRVCGAGGLPYEDDGDGSDLPQLPNPDWPSDHLPISADFVLQ
eukprot:gene14775-18754_t